MAHYSNISITKEIFLYTLVINSQPISQFGPNWETLKKQSYSK